MSNNTSQLRGEIRYILLETVQFSHSNGNYIVIEPTEATEHLIALIHQQRAEAAKDVYKFLIGWCDKEGNLQFNRDGLEAELKKLSGGGDATT